MRCARERIAPQSSDQAFIRVLVFNNFLIEVFITMHGPEDQALIVVVDFFEQSRRKVLQAHISYAILVERPVRPQHVYQSFNRLMRQCPTDRVSRRHFRIVEDSIFIAD